MYLSKYILCAVPTSVVSVATAPVFETFVGH